jgi:hypothetical protein
MAKPLRKVPGPVVWGIRLATVGIAIAGIWIGWNKFHPTDEQEELTRYVENMVPSYLEQEKAVYARLDRLDGQPGPTPEEARKLFVDEVIPRLIALKTQAQGVVAKSAPMKRVNDEYLAYVDRLIEACRVSVRTIDDTTTNGAEGNKLVRQRFYEAGQASKTWSAHLREACIKAGLSPPPSS